MLGPEEEAERLIRCFDPDASLVEGEAECLVISPRWGRLRRAHPLLASSPGAQGSEAAWQAARRNLLSTRDGSIQLALSTYQYRVRITVPIAPAILADPHFDLQHYCCALLDRQGREKNAVILRPEAFWIRSLPPDPEGFIRFEFGNTFLIPITESAMAAESKTLLLQWR